MTTHMAVCCGVVILFMGISSRCWLPSAVRFPPNEYSQLTRDCQVTPGLGAPIGLLGRVAHVAAQSLLMSCTQTTSPANTQTDYGKWRLCSLVWWNWEQIPHLTEHLYGVRCNWLFLSISNALTSIQNFYNGITVIFAVSTNYPQI